MPVRHGVVLAIIFLLAGCGSDASIQDKQTVKRRPAPNAADIERLKDIAIQTPIVCGYVQLDGAGELDTFVSDLIGMNRRTDPNAPITLQAGAGATTLQTFTEDIARQLSATNAYNKPTCAPNLGQRLYAAIGAHAP